MAKGFNSGTGQRRPIRCVLATLAIALLTVGVSSPSARAQTFKVLYQFKGGADGSAPGSGLVRDGAGNLYGGNGGGAYGFGKIFKIDPTGKETVIYNFTGGADGGEGAFARLVRDGLGNLYGTTSDGGANDLGTVFKLDTTGMLTVLYNFTLGDGAGAADLARDAAGNLYGTIYYTGAYVDGTVFKVDTTGTETLLHSFAGPPADGTGPAAGVVLDGAGNLYGTTYAGGAHNEGTVFKIDTTGTETLLQSFAGYPTDGRGPESRLVRDNTGRLYGTTRWGGSKTLGTVFRLGTLGKDTLLYSFNGGVDGGNPFPGVVRDGLGNLYGTTQKGGDLSCNPPLGCGTVFKVGPTGTETVLYSFKGKADGFGPTAPLVRDTAGNLYGVAVGGAFAAGLVFKVVP